MIDPEPVEAEVETAHKLGFAKRAAIHTLQINSDEMDLGGVSCIGTLFGSKGEFAERAVFHTLQMDLDGVSCICTLLGSARDERGPRRNCEEAPSISAC